MEMDGQQLRGVLDFAVEAAQLAGALTLGYFNAGTPQVQLQVDAGNTNAAGPDLAFNAATNVSSTKSIVGVVDAGGHAVTIMFAGVLAALLAIAWAELTGSPQRLRPALFAWLIGSVMTGLSGVVGGQGLQASYGGSVVTASGLIFIAAATDDRPELRGRFEQLGRLVADDLQITRLIDTRVVAVHQLQHFAFGDYGRGVGENAQHVNRAIFHHHLEGAAEKKIADENACLIAEESVGRRSAAAAGTVVHHIIMNQCCRMNQFNNRCSTIGAFIYSSICNHFCR